MAEPNRSWYWLDAWVERNAMLTKLNKHTIPSTVSGRCTILVVMWVTGIANVGLFVSSTCTAPIQSMEQSLSASEMTR